MRSPACAFATLFLIAHSEEALTIANGQLNVIDDLTYSSQSIEVRDGPGGAPTTVRIIDGGRISLLVGHEHSIVEVPGGEIVNSATLYDAATLAVTGGDIGRHVYLRQPFRRREHLRLGFRVKRSTCTAGSACAYGYWCQTAHRQTRFG